MMSISDSFSKISAYFVIHKIMFLELLIDSKYGDICILPWNIK